MLHADSVCTNSTVPEYNRDASSPHVSPNCEHCKHLQDYITICEETANTLHEEIEKLKQHASSEIPPTPPTPTPPPAIPTATTKEHRRKTVWLNYMEDALGTAYSENKGIILLGDFNIDLLPDRNHPHVKLWTDVVSNFELEQIITQPTRITETTSTLIDHIYVNTNVNIKNSDVIQWSISDLFPVYAAIETDNNLKNKTNNKNT